MKDEPSMSVAADDSVAVDILLDEVARGLYRNLAIDNPIPLFSTVDIEFEPGERALVPTGLSTALPSGYAGFITIDATCAEKGLCCLNAPGLVDCQYRGEVKVIMQNCDTDTPCVISRGAPVAFMAIRPTFRLSF
jgi:dUTP pyrophosphatase